MKICKTCRYSEHGYSLSRCEKFSRSYIDNVTGDVEYSRYIYCRQARADEDMCGGEGKSWEVKETLFTKLAKYIGGFKVK